MIKAAGILFISPQGNALFLKRGLKGDHPGEWCFPGGVIEGDETPEEAASREAIEEIGHLPEGTRIVHTRARGSTAGTPVVVAAGGAGNSSPPPAPPVPVDFTTFSQKIKEQFEPTLNDEHVGFAWAPLDAPPEPLHPGCRVALRRFGMHELEVAQAIVAGELISPQKFHNVWLFDMRITGTGVAFRPSLNEFTYRRPENYLTPEFLARCNGLSIIWLHPKKTVLDSKEFSDRTIGSMLLPYLKNDEVWGVAKVYDEIAAKEMIDKQLSTSPAVILQAKGNVTMKLEDGSTLLIEGKPGLLDHLAICEHGVWDKGEGPTGITRGDSSMPTPEEIAEAKKKADAEEKEKADAAAKADAAKADADAGEKLDKILECLDSVGKRMDAFEEKEKEKADAEEKAKADAARQVGDPEQLAADKAKKDAEEETKAKEKADAEEKEKKEMKADSASLKERIDELSKLLPKAPTDKDYADMADAQAKADSVFQMFGKAAPRPLQGETIIAYRRRTANELKTHSKEWKDIDLSSLPDAALGIAEGRIYADSMEAALHPSDIPDGQLREVPRVDPLTGLRTTNFYGPRTFISQLKRPSRYVERINTHRKEA